MTPELHPVFGGTYFPPEDQHFMRRPGFKSVLRSLAEHWEEDKEKLLHSGKQIVKALDRAEKSQRSAEAEFAAEEVVKKCFTQLLQSYDPEMGGFSKAPKFPQPANLNFLFRLYSTAPKSDRGKQALKMALRQLDCMALGGINDHVAKGFARYSTDAEWHVPHFEKMLYDQGQLAVSYASAVQASTAEQRDYYAKILGDILEYVERDMQHPLGGFYSAQDADSLPAESDTKKREGAFCVWVYEDMKVLLNDIKLKKGQSTLFELVAFIFHARSGGNCDPRMDPHGELKGQNCLTRFPDLSEEALDLFKIESKQELEEEIERAREILFEERLKRPMPHLDDKILTSWNGLMISGFISASNALSEPNHLKTALKAIDFVESNLYDATKGVLYRSVYTEGPQVKQLETPIEGFTDDYAFFIRALLDAFEATGSDRYLNWACRLQEKQNELFLDGENGGYYTAPSTRSEELVLRLKEDQDGAEPASNSITSQNLVRFSVLNAEKSKEYSDLATKIFTLFAPRLMTIPVALPEMSGAVLAHSDTMASVIVTGNPNCEVKKSMLKFLGETLFPNKVVIQNGNGPWTEFMLEKNPILKDIPTDLTSAYICKNFSCSLPVKTVEELRTQIEGLRKEN